jgi:5-carboxymethyl-2-hydroxymuconate isomerase
MRFLTFEAGGKRSFGMVDGSGVIDLGPRMKETAGVIALLTPDAQKRAAAAAKGAVADYKLDQIAYLRPVPYPEKIICIGVNYGNRAAEYTDQGQVKTTYPSVFLRFPESMVGHNQPMIRPKESEQLDYEGEIGLIIGRGGRRIPRERALESIAALTCVNEGAVRDWMRHGQFNVTQGKNFDATGAYGPWIVTADEFGNYDDVGIETRVNGEVRQKDSTRNILFDFAYIVSYLSTFATLKTGDVICSGTPTGSGARLNPPKWLKAGDVVEVEISGVGVLRNPIAAD